MEEQQLVQAPQSYRAGHLQAMHTPEDVSAMLKLASLECVDEYRKLTADRCQDCPRLRDR
jgi:hypothetical protein